MLDSFGQSGSWSLNGKPELFQITADKTQRGWIRFKYTRRALYEADLHIMFSNQL